MIEGAICKKKTVEEMAKRLNSKNYCLPLLMPILVAVVDLAATLMGHLYFPLRYFPQKSRPLNFANQNLSG